MDLDDYQNHVPRQKNRCQNFPRRSRLQADRRRTSDNSCQRQPGKPENGFTI